MTDPKSHRRKVMAGAASTVLHVLVLTFLVTREPPPYPEPDITAQPMDVTILPMPRIPPPPPEVIIPPKVVPRKVEVKPEPAPIPVPTPPKPEPPKPEPPKPAPPKPAPPIKVTLLPPKPLPPKPVPPTISALPTPTLTPAHIAPIMPPTPAAPAPPTPTTQISPSPSPTLKTTKLNIHKPEKDAPAGVPTLPMAPTLPAGGPNSAAALAGAAFAAPGSRLSGLNPYPYGAIPSGGSGLRGTLVGCANASAVGLSSVERAHCNERFGVHVDRAPALDGINPAKRAGFDHDAAQQERDRNSRGVDPLKAMQAGHAMPRDADIQSGPASAIH